jgi:adenylate kinase
VYKAIERQTAIGIQAAAYVEKDLMVPDKIMLGLVSNRLNETDVQEKGFLLVGFPMTSGQAFGLQKRGILPTHIGTDPDAKGVMK